MDLSCSTAPPSPPSASAARAMVVPHRQRLLYGLLARQARLQQTALSSSTRTLPCISNTTQTTPRRAQSTYGSHSPSPAPPRSPPRRLQRLIAPPLEASFCPAPGVLRGAPREYAASAVGVSRPLRRHHCLPARRAHPVRRRRPSLETSTFSAPRTRHGRSHHSCTWIPARASSAWHLGLTAAGLCTAAGYAVRQGMVGMVGTRLGSGDSHTDLDTYPCIWTDIALHFIKAFFVPLNTYDTCHVYGE
jgi:hypothetical protein